MFLMTLLCGLLQISALLPAAKLKMPQFGQRYCLSNNHFDKYSGDRSYLFLRTR